MPIPDVVTVGEAMALLIARQPGPLDRVGEFERATAGAELNVAVGLSRLGFRVGYVSGLGEDSLGRNLRDFMTAEGVDTRHVRIDPRYPTGFMLKTMVEDGSDPEVEYFRRGSAASYLSAADAPEGDFRQARLLHLTGISPALSFGCRALVLAMARQARADGRIITFDPNLRPRLWPSQQAMIAGVNEIAALADVVMPGLAEGRLLTGRTHAADIADFYLALGARQVVVKLGAEGAYYADAGTVPGPRTGSGVGSGSGAGAGSGSGSAAGADSGSGSASGIGYGTGQGRGVGADLRGIAPGRPVATVVDTVGAGDGFAVGVISALLDGLPLAAAAARGNAIGARVIQYRGDCEGLPNRAQLGEA